MNVIIANILGVICSVCAAAGIFQKQKKRMMFFLSLNCGISVIANLLLGGYSGAVTQLVNLVRNLLTMAGKMTRRLSVAIMIVMFLAGLWMNRQGALGLLPLIASAEYTLSLSSENMFVLESAILVNMLLWSIYSFLTWNITGGISSLILAIQAGYKVIRLWERGRHACKTAK